MRSISTKLLLAFITVSLAGAVIFFLVARWNSNNEIQDFLSEQDQTQIAEQAAEYFITSGSWDGFGEDWPSPPPESAPGQPRRGPFSPFILVGADQKVIFSRGGHSDQYNQGDFVPTKDLENAVEINSEGETIGWLLVTRINWREFASGHTIFRSMDMLLMYSALGSLVVAIILSLLLSRRLSQPLQQLTTAAQQAATGDLSHKVIVNSKDEIGILADSFNQMMEDLERLIAARKQMTADIAHELRTPITVILGHAESVHDGVMEPNLENFEIIRDEALRLERMIKDLRLLSQADVGELPLELGEISIPDLISAVERTIQTSLQEKKLLLEIDIEPHLPVLEVDSDRILQAIRNIFDNAIRHTPEGGKILIRVKQNEEFVLLSIQDGGPGIAAEELDKVFQRFYRSDSARVRDREGSGLGLAITRSIIEQHGGKVWAESPEGEGLKVIIKFPVTRPH